MGSSEATFEEFQRLISGKDFTKDILEHIQRHILEKIQNRPQRDYGNMKSEEMNFSTGMSLVLIIMELILTFFIEIF